ncbi:MAG: PQQ-binding-like beta-propeller repeat protein [Isosphaeraceae bacterium]
MITALCTSRDPVGNTLAVCGHKDGSVAIWRLDSRSRLLAYRPPGVTDCVASLAVAECQGEPIVVGSWANGSVWAFRQATGETTGHWARAAKADARRLLTNVVTVHDEGTPLAAVGDDTELLLFELPTLAVRAHRPDAAKASLYSLAVARWNNRPVIVSGGDTLNEDGKHAESYPVKLWGIDGLERLLEGGEDAHLADRLLVFEEGGESFLVTKPFLTVTVWRLADLGLAAPPLQTTDDFIAVYPANGHTVIFGLDHGRMRVWSARRVCAADPAVSAIELSRESTDTGADAPGLHWSTVVQLDGRPILLSAAAERVHVLDVIELLRPAGFPAGAVPTTSGVLSLAGSDDTLFLGTYGGAVSAWDRAGNHVWSRDLPPSEIRSLAVGAGGAELLAGGSDGKIYRLDAATGGERQPALAAGSAVRALVVRRTARGKQVFAAIEVKEGFSESFYFTRAWSLSTGAEIPTWTSKAGPEVLQGVFQWTTSKRGVNGFEPALALPGYYRTKSLLGMTAFEFEGRTVIALAGPHGLVRVMDAGALEELVAWVGGSIGELVFSLAGGVVGGVPYVFGGDGQGVLFRGGTSSKEVDIRRPQAHRGVISVVTLRETPRGGLLASGGNDGWVRVWTPDLERLVEINAEWPVTSLVWLGDDLVIATDRGVLCVTVRWQAVFGAA